MRIVRMRAAYVQKVHPAVQADREDLANELATAARSGIHEPHGPVHPKVAGPVRPLHAGGLQPWAALPLARRPVSVRTGSGRNRRQA